MTRAFSTIISFFEDDEDLELSYWEEMPPAGVVSTMEVETGRRFSMESEFSTD